MDGSRCALIVANDRYQDPGLRQLRSPARDAQALAQVLGDRDIGGFQVRVMHNEAAHVINESVEEFFADRRSDDLLLLHFSCHGVKDEGGDLYFAAHNTRLGRLGATAVAADFVSRLMNRSRSKRIVLLLDCCYSGAFERGFMARATDQVAIDEQFGGRGRAVITASTAMEYAFEGGDLSSSNRPTPSVFTSAVVRALQTGEADRDGDGYISLDELYDYVFDEVRAATPHQTPSKSVVGVQGDLYIARRKLPTAPHLPPVPTVWVAPPPPPVLPGPPRRGNVLLSPFVMGAAALVTLTAVGAMLLHGSWTPVASHLAVTPPGPTLAGGPTASPTPSATPTPATSRPSSPSGPSSPTQQSATSLPVSRCHTADLSLSFVTGSGGSASGHQVLTFQLKNVSSGPCSLYGFVGMQMLDAASGPIPTRVVRNGGLFSTHAGPSQVVVGPNTAAFFQISWSDVPVGSETCRQSSHLVVTPPDEVATLQEVGPVMAPCNGGEIDVTPMVASLS